MTALLNRLHSKLGDFASTFRNELTALAINRKFGQMKTLIRGVFIATAVFLFLAIVICRIILPAYLERIRVAEGSLAFVVIITSFITAIAPIYNNALQSLKKFKASSALALFGAPLRLITMLVTTSRNRHLRPQVSPVRSRSHTLSIALSFNIKT